MKAKNVKVGLRVQYKGDVCGKTGAFSECVYTGCLGTVVDVDGTDRPLVSWDDVGQIWTYVDNFKKVK